MLDLFAQVNTAEWANKRQCKGIMFSFRLISSYHSTFFTTRTAVFDRSSSGRSCNEEEAKGDLLVLSSTLLPEPNASAAGVRTASLLNYFANTRNKNSNLFHCVHFGCGVEQQQPATNNKKGTTLPHYDNDVFPNLKNVLFHHIPPNRSKSIKELFQKNNQVENLQAVIFDRFFSEEVYSFHFYHHKPNVLRVLDMQDMHSLRAHRQYLVENEYGSSQRFELSNDITEEVISSYPMLERNPSSNLILNNAKHDKKKSKKDSSSILLRELASIHRSDLTLVCSPYELTLLRDEYGIPQHKLALASFFIERYTAKPEHDRNHSFDKRRDFVTLGGFKHPPNIDQVKVLKYDIWPKIRKQIPDANLYVYGAYPPQSILQLHDKRAGFHIKGYADSLEEILSSSKVMLAPLRYGAGIKGKIIDSWKFGCPVVTTPIGSEGMTVEGMDDWGGHISFDSDAFVQNAVALYTDKDEWMIKHSKGMYLLEHLFDAETNFIDLQRNLGLAMKNLDDRRNRDYYSSILWQQQARSTEYFSKWIEQKESASSSPQ